MRDKTITALGAVSVTWRRARELVSAHPGPAIVFAALAVVAAGVWL